MNISFEAFINKLEVRLNSNLPGEEGHALMMPQGRSRELREEAMKIKDYRLGGVLIALFPRENTIAFPLTLRHDYPGVHAGQVSLPGGRKEDIDEDLISTALRETEEEVGVPTSKVKVIGTLSELFIPPSRYRITPVVGIIDEIPQFTIDPREVKELFLADIEHILNPEYRKSKDIKVRGKYQIAAPYFDIQKKTVWGATAMILGEFSKIVEDILEKP